MKIMLKEDHNKKDTTDLPSPLFKASSTQTTDKRIKFGKKSKESKVLFVTPDVPVTTSTNIGTEPTVVTTTEKPSEDDTELSANSDDDTFSPQVLSPRMASGSSLETLPNVEELKDGKKTLIDNFIKKKPTFRKKKPFSSSEGLNTEEIAKRKAKLEKLAEQENIEITRPPRKSSVNLDTQSSVVTLENMDRINLPVGFPPMPDKPVYPHSPSEEEKKEYMKQKLKYDDWESSLLLYYRRTSQQNLM